MTYRYIPILRWKRGEKRGIHAVAEPMSKDVWPLIIVTPNTFADRQETVRREPMSAPEIFADEVYKHWGARPFYLDASDIEPSARGVHPLMATAKLSRELGAHLIPATTLDASTPYDAAVLQVTREDKRGAALRIKLRELTSAAQWLSDVPEALTDQKRKMDFRGHV